MRTMLPVASPRDDADAVALAHLAWLRQSAAEEGAAARAARAALRLRAYLTRWPGTAGVAAAQAGRCLPAALATGATAPAAEPPALRRR